MINIMNSGKTPMNEKKRELEPQLWHACAGGMVQIPNVDSLVFYFPQGHAEHANTNVDFGNLREIPPYILCRVLSIKYLADTETDEVYTKVGLIPVSKGFESTFDVEEFSDFRGFGSSEGKDKANNSFSKTLTQSDANNGGGFSVPRYCAETIFPLLDHKADPPLQTIFAKDVHGEVFKFRHIYRGTPRRHLLTTGWSFFVNKKKLIAGDSIVFSKGENGELSMGIRRAKRGIYGNSEASGWNPPGFSGFLKDSKKGERESGGRLEGESVIEAVNRAVNGEPFEVIYYPCSSAPEFVVKASAVKAAMRVPWCSPMRFKMPFETEESSRISWFMGTISSVQVDDPIRWPNSPWRLLQVVWDEPELLQNVKRVSPWLVEIVSNIPAIHLSPFTQPRKKMRLTQTPEFPVFEQFQMPRFIGNPINPSSPFCYLSNNNIPTGVQGARHAQFTLPSPEVHFNNLRAGQVPLSFKQIDRPAQPTSSKTGKEMTDTPLFYLFGKPILTEKQISQCRGENSSDGSGSTSTVHQNVPSDNSSDEVIPWYKQARR